PRSGYSCTLDSGHFSVIESMMLKVVSLQTANVRGQLSSNTMGRARKVSSGSRSSIGITFNFFLRELSWHFWHCCLLWPFFPPLVACEQVSWFACLIRSLYLVMQRCNSDSFSSFCRDSS